MDSDDSPEHIEYIRAEGGDCKSWSNEEMQELNSSLKICCVPLPRRLFLFVKYVAPTLVLLLSFAADIGSGVAVAVRHYADNHIWWFSLTVLFLCAPSVMFVAHAILQTLTNPDIHLKKKLLWIVLYVFTGAGLLLWPLWGYFKQLVYAIRAFLDEENGTIHLEKFHSIAATGVTDNMHKMFKAFLQSAPQLLLQMYILISAPPNSQDTYTVAAEVVSVLFSLNSLAVVIVHFETGSKHHPSRTASAEQRPETGDLCCVAVEYLWWLCSVSARVLALALFAAVFRYWVFVLCLIHSATVTACLLLHHQPGGCSLASCLVAVFVGFIYIFCFVEYKVDFGRLGRVVGLYVLYYAFTFVQNTCMVLSAYFLAAGDPRLALVLLHFACFVLAVVLMLFYLGLLRPFQLRMLRRTDSSPINE